MSPKLSDPVLDQVVRSLKEWQRGRSFREPIPQKLLGRLRDFNGRYTDPVLARRA